MHAWYLLRRRFKVDLWDIGIYSVLYTLYKKKFVFHNPCASLCTGDVDDVASLGNSQLLFGGRCLDWVLGSKDFIQFLEL